MEETTSKSIEISWWLFCMFVIEKGKRCTDIDTISWGYDFFSFSKRKDSQDEWLYRLYEGINIINPTRRTRENFFTGTDGKITLPVIQDLFFAAKLKLVDTIYISQLGAKVPYDEKNKENSWDEWVDHCVSEKLLYAVLTTKSPGLKYPGGFWNFIMSNTDINKALVERFNELFQISWTELGATAMSPVAETTNIDLSFFKYNNDRLYFRDNEKEAFRDFLKNPKHNFLNIYGESVGGVGKTHLVESCILEENIDHVKINGYSGLDPISLGKYIGIVGDHHSLESITTAICQSNKVIVIDDYYLLKNDVNYELFTNQLIKNQNGKIIIITRSRVLDHDDFGHKNHGALKIPFFKYEETVDLIMAKYGQLSYINENYIQKVFKIIQGGWIYAFERFIDTYRSVENLDHIIANGLEFDLLENEGLSFTNFIFKELDLNQNEILILLAIAIPNEGSSYYMIEELTLLPTLTINKIIKKFSVDKTVVIPVQSDEPVYKMHALTRQAVLDKYKQRQADLRWRYVFLVIEEYNSGELHLPATFLVEAIMNIEVCEDLLQEKADHIIDIGISEEITEPSVIFYSRIKEYQFAIDEEDIAAPIEYRIKYYLLFLEKESLNKKYIVKLLRAYQLTLQFSKIRRWYESQEESVLKDLEDYSTILSFYIQALQKNERTSKKKYASKVAEGQKIGSWYAFYYPFLHTNKKDLSLAWKAHNFFKGDWFHTSPIFKDALYDSDADKLQKAFHLLQEVQKHTKFNTTGPYFDYLTKFLIKDPSLSTDSIERYFDEFYVKTNDNPQKLLILANSLAQNGYYQRAADMYTQVNAFKDFSIGKIYYLEFLFKYQKHLIPQQSTEPIALLNTILKDPDRNLRHIDQLGVRLVRDGEMIAAEICFQTILKKHPKNPSTYVNLIGLLNNDRFKSQYKNGINDIDKLFALGNKNLEKRSHLYTKYIDFLIKKKRHQTVIPILDQAIDLDIKTASIYTRYYEVYEKNIHNIGPEVVNRIEHVLTLGKDKFPKNGYVYTALAKFFQSTGHPEKSIRILEEGLNTIPENSILPFDLAELYSKNKTYSEKAYLLLYERAYSSGNKFGATKILDCFKHRPSLQNLIETTDHELLEHIIQNSESIEAIMSGISYCVIKKHLGSKYIDHLKSLTDRALDMSKNEKTVASSLEFYINQNNPQKLLNDVKPYFHMLSTNQKIEKREKVEWRINRLQKRDYKKISKWREVWSLLIT